MNEKGWLLCEIKEEGRGGYLLTSELFDGTPFELKVPKTSAVKSGTSRAWLEIEWQGKEPGGTKYSITLPYPVLNFGHRISIHENRLNKNIFVKPDIVTQHGIMPDQVLTPAQQFTPAANKVKLSQEAAAAKLAEAKTEVTVKEQGNEK